MDDLEWLSSKNIERRGDLMLLLNWQIKILILKGIQSPVLEGFKKEMGRRFDIHEDEFYM